MADLTERVLDIYAFDACDDVWWRTDGEYAPVTFIVNCNDLFFWGCADGERITPENIDLLEQTMEDVEKATGERFYHEYANLLFCARVRKQRPQGAFYEHLPDALHPFFDACGSLREVGIGNPQKHPSQQHSQQEKG